MVVLHLPIGFLTLAALLEAWSLWKKTPWAHQANSLVLPISALSAAAAAGLGWFRAGTGSEFDPALLQQHRWTGVGIVVFATLAALVRPGGAVAPTGSRVWAYRGLLGVAMALLGAAGHFGGSLTHGSGFLTKNAPGFVRTALGDAPPATAAVATPKATESPSAKPSTNTTESASGSTGVYRTVIQPALQQRCYSCHGPDKQKGKLRLDRRENALAGGESGEPSIQPGDIRKSRLLYHVLLPRAHDDAMPPEGKEPLTPEQILAISQWIQQGASFD